MPYILVRGTGGFRAENPALQVKTSAGFSGFLGAGSLEEL
jgi:hypothetical protein